MVANLSKIVMLYIGPVLYLTSLLLTILAFSAPVPIFHTTVSLMSVYPAARMGAVAKRDVEIPEMRRLPRAALVTRVAQISQAAAAPAVDGPTVRLGPLGSCARKSNNANDICTIPSFDTTYDFTVLPTSAPLVALPINPAETSPVLFLIALIFSLIFFILHLLSTLPMRGIRMPGFVAKAAFRVARPAAWIGLFGFAIGMLTTIMWQVQFGKDVSNFNLKIAQAGAKAPQLQASLGNGFTMLYVGYAFAAPALLSALFKLQLDGAK